MEIVFVHFGLRLPKYLVRNLQRTCDLFPNQSIIFLSDRAQNVAINNRNFRTQVINFDEEIELVNKSLNHPADFRDNFWFSSLARLMALADYVIDTHQPILHIESDVLISRDFPISKFSALDRPLAYTMVGEHSGVASLLFLRSAEAARFFKRYIVSAVLNDANTTDMKILGLLQSQYPDSVRILGSFPLDETNAYAAIHLSIKNDFEYTQNLFNGYFDSADIGQYLFGDDPRNHRGVKYLRRELASSYLHAGRLNYIFNPEREFIGLREGAVRDIYSLHIHSKNSKLFTQRLSYRLLRKAVLNQSLPERHLLIPSVFLNALKGSIRRRFRRIQQI